MLRVWLRQGALYRDGLLCWGAILIVGAVGDRASEGKAEPLLETFAFGIGMWFANQALTREAREAAHYFAALPIDSGRSRRLTVDAGMLWLLVLMLAGLSFEFGGPAETLLRELWRLSGSRFADGQGALACPVPSLDRLALALLGFWCTTAVMLAAGHLRGALRRLLDVGLLLPMLGAVAGGATARAWAYQDHPAWPTWTRVVLSGSVELLLAACLARSCAKRMERAGTELATRGVRS